MRRYAKMLLMSSTCIIYPWCEYIPLIGGAFREACSHQVNLGWGDHWAGDGEGGSYLAHGPEFWVCAGGQGNTPQNIR